MICWSTENPVYTWVANRYSIVQSLINAPNRNIDLGYERRRCRGAGVMEKFRKTGDLLYQGQK